MPPLDPAKDFQDDGASFRVRRLLELERRELPIIDQGKGFRHWYKTSSPTRIFLTLVLGGFLFFVCYFVITFGALIMFDAMTRH